jgi:hypothetical protein
MINRVCFLIPFFIVIFFFFSVKLEGTVVCMNAKVQESSQLKDCQIGAGYVVDKDSKLKLEFW